MRIYPMKEIECVIICYYTSKNTDRSGTKIAISRSQRGTRGILAT